MLSEPMSDVVLLAEQLQELVEAGDRKAIRAAVDDARPEDVADAFERFETEIGVHLLSALSDEQASHVLEEMSTETARPVLGELPDAVVAHYLDILEMDDALDLEEEIGTERFLALLEVIPDEDKQEVLRLRSHPVESVGRQMTERFFEVKPSDTMADVLADLRAASEEKYE